MGHQHGHGGKAQKKAIKKQDYILMASTFIVGMIGGGYIYIIGFSPQFSDYLSDNQTESVYEDFVIDGEIYGDESVEAEASFQVLKNGSFRYIPAGVTTSEGVKEGVVPKAIWSDVKAMLTASTLASAQLEQIKPDCPSQINPGYVYKVTLNSKQYILDTCMTNFPSKSAPAVALENLWNYFRTLPE